MIRAIMPAQQSREAQAIVCMFGTVLCLSLIPVFIKGGGAAAYPFLFTGAWRLIVCVASLTIVWVCYRHFWRSKMARAAVRKNGINLHFLLGIVSILDYALFAAADRFVDTVIVSVIFEIWPIFFVVYMSLLYRKESRYHKNVLSQIGFMFLAFIGVGFAALSNYDIMVEDSLSSLTFGVSLALLASIATIITAHVFKWATETAKDYKALCDSPDADDEERALCEKLSTRALMPPEVLFAICAYAVCSGLGGVLNIVISAFTGEWHAIGETFADDMAIKILFIFAAGMAYTGVTVLWRLSNVITQNLAINTMIYMVPVITVFLLWFFFGVNIERPDYLLIGAVIIVIANLFVNL